MTDLERAHRTGRWLVNNQVCEEKGKNPAGMDVGRFPVNIDIHDHSIVDRFLSTNWFTGMSIYALQMLHDLDGNDAWLESARLAAHYLRAIQVTMDPDLAANGAFYEYAPYARFCCPRDALSGAWGLLRLHRATGSQEDLARVELFARWHREQAMIDGYPIWTHKLGNGPNVNLFGNFQAGSALFYADLFEVTGNGTYRDTAIRISDFFMDHFWDDNAGPCIEYNPVDGYRGDHRRSGTGDWNEMHKFNDDFSALGLMMNTALTGDGKYFAFAEKYLAWVLANQNGDGSFGRLRLSESSCVVALNLLNAWLATAKDEYLEGARKARGHLLRDWLDTPGVTATDGGVLGLHHCSVPAKKNMISLRVTMYTVYTLVLFGLVERAATELSVPEALRRNPMFPGLRLAETRRG